METNIEPKSEIVKRIKEISESSEARRKQLRFAYNTEKLVRGEMEVLKSSEFVHNLLDSLMHDDGAISENRQKLLENLGQGLIAEDISIRERTLAILSPLTTVYLEADRETFLHLLSHTLARWLENENELLPGYAVMLKQIELLIHWLLERYSWHLAEHLVVLLHRISRNLLPKSATMRSLAGQVLDNLALKSVITRLTDQYLLGNSDQLVIKNILVALGAKAAAYNLGKVIESQSKEERMALLELIPVFGEEVVPVLADCLQHDPPWQVVRNIIYIIARIGSDAHYILVEHYLSHRDERVQYEMIRCVVGLDGPGMIPRLTKALGIVNDRLKGYVIRLLLEHSTKDEGFFNALCDLAEKHRSFSLHSDHDLIQSLATAFKTFPCRHAIVVLQQLKTECAKVSGTEPLCLQLEEAIQVIEPKIRHARQKVRSGRGTVSFDTDPALEQLARSKMHEVEKKLKVLIGAGDMVKIGRLLREQAIAAAEAGEFFLAGMLRDRLMQIDPMALEDAVRLGNLIEELRDGSFAANQSALWEYLKKRMSTEELTTLRSALREERYQTGDVIVREGETDNKLFFLASGYMSLACRISGKESFLKRVQPGDILGCEQFFSASVWTVSLKALSEVRVQVLDRTTLAKITEKYPGVDDILHNYCRKYTDISQLLAMSGSDRREFPRFSGSLMTRSRLVDPYGVTGTKNYEGELVDISRNGLAYTVNVSSKAAARSLLGRQSITDLVLDGEVVRCVGIIVGVRIRSFDSRQYSVHVKLSKLIEKNIFQKIRSLLG